MGRSHKKYVDIKIGKRLKELRLEVGLNVKEVVEAIDYKCGNTLEQWESGCRPVGMKGLRLLAVFFGVNLNWLQTGEGDKYTKKDGENSFAEQIIIGQTMGVMLRITQKYAKVIEEGMAYIPRLAELFKEFEKTTEVEGLNNIEDSRYSEFLVRIRALAVTVHQVSKGAITRKSDYKEHRLIRLESLRNFEKQSKEILEYLSAKGIKKTA